MHSSIVVKGVQTAPFGIPPEGPGREPIGSVSLNSKGRGRRGPRKDEQPQGAKDEVKGSSAGHSSEVARQLAGRFGVWLAAGADAIEVGPDDAGTVAGCGAADCR